MNLLFTRELAKRLDGTGVIAIALDPGFVRTNLGRDATGFFDFSSVSRGRFRRIRKSRARRTSSSTSSVAAETRRHR